MQTLLRNHYRPFPLYTEYTNYIRNKENKFMFNMYLYMRNKIYTSDLHMKLFTFFFKCMKMNIASGLRYSIAYGNYIKHQLTFDSA